MGGVWLPPRDVIGGDQRRWTFSQSGKLLEPGEETHNKTDTTGWLTLLVFATSVSLQVSQPACDSRLLISTRVKRQR